MRVVVMGNSEGLGGAQTAYRRLLDFMREEGHQTGAISIVDGDDAHFDGHSLVFHQRVGVSRSQKYWYTPRAALRARQFYPQVFVSVGLSRSANLVAALLAPHCFRVCQDFIFGRSCSDPLLLRGTGYFDALAVQAPSMLQPLRDQGFAGKLLNWLPCFPAPPAVGRRRVCRPAAAPIKIGYFGRLAHNKGLELFFSALRRLNKDLPIRVDVWGDGPYRKRLEQIVREVDVSVPIKFPGAYPTGDHGADLMCNYDALVLPSTSSEGLPLILLEAMAYGIPVLTTNIGAVRDCCIGNPDFLLVEPNVASIAAGLEDLVFGLASNAFITERLQRYYYRHFSPGVMAARWRSFLAAPGEFFRA